MDFSLKVSANKCKMFLFSEFGKWVVFIQDQYKFIYDTLEEYCRGIDSRFPVSELANKIKEKTVKDKKIKKNAYALEYAVRLGAELSHGCHPVFSPLRGFVSCSLQH